MSGRSRLDDHHISLSWAWKKDRYDRAAKTSIEELQQSRVAYTDRLINLKINSWICTLLSIIVILVVTKKSVLIDVHHVRIILICFWVENEWERRKSSAFCFKLKIKFKNIISNVLDDIEHFWLHPLWRLRILQHNWSDTTQNKPSFFFVTGPLNE